MFCQQRHIVIMVTIDEICAPYVAEGVKATAVSGWIWFLLAILGIVLLVLAFIGGFAFCRYLEKNLGQRVVDSCERNAMRLNSLEPSGNLLEFSP
jgi:nitrate reductase NapE component